MASSAAVQTKSIRSRISRISAERLPSEGHIPEIRFAEEVFDVPPRRFQLPDGVLLPVEDERVFGKVGVGGPAQLRVDEQGQDGVVEGRGRDLNLPRLEKFFVFGNDFSEQVLSLFLR